MSLHEGLPLRKTGDNYPTVSQPNIGKKYRIAFAYDHFQFELCSIFMFSGTKYGVFKKQKGFFVEQLKNIRD